MDEVEPRQAIERQLNKIEHAHRFAWAVSVGNPREFIQAEKQEQEISKGCKRLMKGFPERWIIKLPRCLPVEKFPTFASGRQGRRTSSSFRFPSSVSPNQTA
jgi:hypothetical protein